MSIKHMEHSREGFEQLASEMDEAKKVDEQIDKEKQVANDLDRPLEAMMAGIHEKVREVLHQDGAALEAKIQEYMDLGQDEAIELNKEYETLKIEMLNVQNEIEVQTSNLLTLHKRGYSGYGLDRMEDNVMAEIQDLKKRSDIAVSNFEAFKEELMGVENPVSSRS